MKFTLIGMLKSLWSKPYVTVTLEGGVVVTRMFGSKEERKDWVKENCRVV